MSVLYSSNDSSYYTEVCQGEWLQLLTITKLGLSNEKEDWSWVWNLRVSIFFTKYEDRFQFFYYWEYKLVRSVFLCIYFKTKWMNSSSQLKHCPSLPTTFSHQAIFEFHLEKMTRFGRRSNFVANFRFLWKKWTGDLLVSSE